MRKKSRELTWYNNTWSNETMTNEPKPPIGLERYVRQTVYAPMGEQGQRRLMDSRVLVCGCGALGSTLANLLARAGVGKVRIVDRDHVDVTNLHRQILFDERGAAQNLPKAIAAAERLGQINSTVEVEPIVATIDRSNIEEFCQGVDAIVDGTDNFETRFLINDMAIKHGLPWVYGGCLGAEGQTMTIVPGKTACLRCLIHECPEPGSMPTVAMAGVMGPIVGVVASIEAIEAIKILSGNLDAVSTNLTVVELWDSRIRQVDLSLLREQVDCPTCHHGQFPWLDGE